MEKEELKISDIIKVLYKRKRSIIIITVCIGMLAGIMNYCILVPVYETSVRIFVGKSMDNDENYNTDDIQTYQKLLSTYVEIVKTNDLMEKAVNNHDLDRSVNEILSNIYVAPITDTQILEISYTDTDKYIAKDVVQAVSDEFINESRKLIPAGRAEIVDKVRIPNEPQYPKKKRNVLLSFILGIILSSGLAMVIEITDDSVKNEKQLEELEVEIIGVIPSHKKVRGVV